jgi:hypothetical protein
MLSTVAVIGIGVSGLAMGSAQAQPIPTPPPSPTQPTSTSDELADMVMDVIESRDPASPTTAPQP